MDVTLDKFGRIVIPKTIRDRLGLTAGTQLRLEAGEREIALRAVDPHPRLIKEDGLLICTADLAGDTADFDVVDHLRKLRQERIEAISPAARSQSNAGS